MKICRSYTRYEKDSPSWLLFWITLMSGHREQQCPVGGFIACLCKFMLLLIAEIIMIRIGIVKCLDISNLPATNACMAYMLWPVRLCGEVHQVCVCMPVCVCCVYNMCGAEARSHTPTHSHTLTHKHKKSIAFVWGCLCIHEASVTYICIWVFCFLLLLLERR